MVTSTEHWDSSWTEAAPALSPEWRFSGLTSRRGSWPRIQGEDVSVFTSTGQRPTTLFAIATLSHREQDDTLLNSIGFFLKQKLLSMESVKAVYYSFDEEPTTISVWTVLRQANETVRRGVYAGELELLEEFPSVIFNFRTTDVSGEDTPASGDYHRLQK